MRRMTVNTSGFAPPTLDHGPVRPDPVVRDQLNPLLTEPPPAGAYALRPVEKFHVPTTNAEAPRAIIEADFPELFEWGIPLYIARHPGATVESMMPLARRAVQGYPYRALRTPSAFGIFLADQKPWQAAPEVVDICVAWREPDDIHQAVQICRYAREWAKSIKATQFWLVQCDDDLTPLAERLGLKIVRQSYGCDL